MADITNNKTALVNSEEVPLNTAPFREDDTKESPPVYEGNYRRPEEQKMFRQGVRNIPQDYMIVAILVTIFCCTPCGVVALAYAAETRIHTGLGDYENANRFSRQAKRWAIWSLTVGVIVIVCLVVVEFTVVAGILRQVAQLESHMSASPQFAL